MDRYVAIKKVGVYGIVSNIFLLCLKAFFGIISHSQAMIADAANSAGDILASTFTYIGGKISNEPSDENHNMGHGKAEYIFSLFISIAMMFLAYKIVVSSVASIINQQKIIFSWFLIVVCLITIIIKSVLYLYARKVHKINQSILVMANLKDHRNDCFVAAITLISILLSSWGLYWLDGLAGIGISLWIFYTGYQILMQSYNVLMDVSIDEKSKKIIKQIIKKDKRIIKVGQISTIPIGSKFIVVISIYVDGNMPTNDSHQITLDIAAQIKRQVIAIDRAIIHVNPFLFSK